MCGQTSFSGNLEEGVIGLKASGKRNERAGERGENEADKSVGSPAGAVA